MILSTLIFLPLLGALLTGLLPGTRAPKILALMVSLWVLGVAASLFTGFDAAHGGFQFTESRPLIEALGIRYAVGVDGISLLLILLAAFVTPLAILGSFASRNGNSKGFYASILLLESSVLGALTAMDLFLFYLFWELMLIPAFFLIGLWGGERRVRAVLKFVLFTMLGSLFMLVGLLLLVRSTGSFDYNAAFGAHLPQDLQFWCFLAFGAAFLVKIPIFPLHGWLPDAYSEAPPAGSALLSGVLVKLGAYGLLRFCIPLFPQAAQEFAPILSGLALAGLIHGALMASIQTDYKRLLAYSSLSHMGLAVLGILTFSLTGLQGGIFQMLSHGAAMTGLFLLAGMLEERRRSRNLEDLGAVAVKAPWLAAFFLWMILAAVGLPGFSGFVGELLILVALYQDSPLLAFLALSGFVLSAWYLFNLFGKVFLGKVRKKEEKESGDLGWSEILALLPAALAVLWMGLQPNPLLRPVEKSLQMKVIEKLKPPPAMTDFAVQQRRIQEAIEDAKKDKQK